MLVAVLSEKAHNHQNLIVRALKTGYDVIVLTARPEKISLQHSKLQIIRGSTEDESAVHKLVEGVDAVICLFEKQTTTAIKNVVSGVQYHDVRRCIFFSEKPDTSKPPQNQGRLKRLFRTLSSEDIDTTDIIRQSNRDWTILHPFDQSDMPTAQHHIDISGDTYEKMKDNFARFILGQIADTTYLSKVLSI